MRVLLDTHALLWYVFGDPSLSATARAVLDDRGNERLVSLASLWEVAIKISKGKLVLRVSYREFARRAVDDNGFVLLPIAPDHVGSVVGLPYPANGHRDPFDRMLVAQAMVEGIPLVTCDAMLAPYPVVRMW